MIFLLGVLFNIVVCSFFLFPIGFTFIPSGINTKILLAVLGLLFVYRNANKTFDVPYYYFGIFLFGALFSGICLFAVFFNDTSDYSYASYLISMSVWLFAAYTIVLSIKNVHGYILFRILVNYLITVCILQGCLALIIDSNPVFKLLVDSYVLQIAGSTEFLNKVDRLYGLGAALDPAGVRFAGVLILIAGIIHTDRELSKWQYMFLSVSFFLILGLGNFISRTTTVGAIIGLAYLAGIFMYRNLSKELFINRGYAILFLSAILIFFAGYVIYTNSEDMRGLIRFGFEGFFRWVEYGDLKTDSTDTLKTMWVFPDNLKTWIIGDGYFNDPLGSGGYYMFTDVGYLRFIFYCGLLGLVTFSVFFIYTVSVLGEIYPRERTIFYLLLVLGFLVWIKVSTDIFQLYALFLAMAAVSDRIHDNKTEIT